MKILLPISNISLALAIVYAGFSIAHRPMYQPILSEASETVIQDSTDEQIEEYLDTQEDFWYPLESWFDVPDEEFESQGI